MQFSTKKNGGKFFFWKNAKLGGEGSEGGLAKDHTFSGFFFVHPSLMLFCCKITCVAIYALLVSNFWAGNGAGVQKKTNMKYVQCTLCMRALGKWKLNTNQMERLQVVAPPWKISQEGSAGCDQIFSYFCSDRILWNMKNTIGARTNQGWKQRQRTVL